MRYLFLIFPFIALGQTVNFSTYGGNGDGVTDNASAWASMKAAYLNGDFTVLEISSGTYDFNSTVDIAGCNGITIQAADVSNKPLLFTDAGINWILHTQANTDDVTITNIRFENAGTIPSASQAATLAFSDARFFRHTISGCEFATTNASNGIKYYITNNVTDFAGNITFSNNLFENIGQMGVEFVNHRDDLFPGNTDYGYDNVLFENNTFTNVGTANAFGMAISMSGEGETVTVQNNTFTDCPNTAVEFIGTDNSLVQDNAFFGNTRAYNFVRGSGRTNDNNIIRGNSGDITQGAIFINVTNTLIEDEQITFGERFFMQGIRNITLNNCYLTGVGDVISFRSATSAEQEVNSDEGILRIDNSVITSTSSPALDVQSVHHQMTLQVNCSQLRVSSGTNYISEAGGNGVTITYNNTERYSGGALQDTQNAAGASNCLAMPLATGSNATKQVITNVVTAASRGIVYDDFGVDNSATIEQMAIDMWNGVFDAVVFESGRTVNFETTADWNHTNVPTDAIGGGIWYTDGVGQVTFYSDNNICTLMTTTPGVGPINWTFDNIRFEHAFNGTLAGCGSNNSSASIISFHHSDNGGSRNVYFEDCEFTAPNAYTDGFSAFSQAIDGIVDYTFLNCNFNNTGRMLFEVFGQRAGDLSTYNPISDAYVKRFTLEGGNYTDGGLINELGISIVQSFYDLKIDGIATANSAAQLEIGVTHFYCKDVVQTGTGDGGWYAGIYDDFNSPLFIQSDYVFENYQVNVTNGIEFFGGIRDVTINNSSIEIDDRWWNLNTYGTFTINNSDLKLGDDGSNLIELQLDKANYVINNTEIEKLTNTNLFEDRSVVSMSCVNVLLDGSESFTSTGYASLSDVQLFNSGVPGTEFGDTTIPCPAIGYQGVATPSPSGSINSNQNIIKARRQ